jgi:hypothetical protein
MHLGLEVSRRSVLYIACTLGVCSLTIVTLNGAATLKARILEGGRVEDALAMEWVRIPVHFCTFVGSFVVFCESATAWCRYPVFLIGSYQLIPAGVLSHYISTPLGPRWTVSEPSRSRNTPPPPPPRSPSPHHPPTIPPPPTHAHARTPLSPGRRRWWTGWSCQINRSTCLKLESSHTCALMLMRWPVSVVLSLPFSASVSLFATVDINRTKLILLPNMAHFYPLPTPNPFYLPYNTNTQPCTPHTPPSAHHRSSPILAGTNQDEAATFVYAGLNEKVPEVAFDPVVYGNQWSLNPHSSPLQ